MRISDCSSVVCSSDLNSDADYTGKYAASTCYNSEKAYDLGGMMRNERDWVVVFNIPRIEAAIKAGKFITLDGSKVPVADGRKTEDRKSTRLNSSHSCASRMPSSACRKKNKD